MSVRHDALIFATDDELVEGTHDLIEQGLLAGDLVIVFGAERGETPLRDAWRDDPRISFVATSAFYEHPMRTIAEFQRLADREGRLGHDVRATGPVPFGEDPRARRGWMAYEALVDRALAPYGFVSLCQYDTRVLDGELVEHARATHDRVVSSGGVEVGGRRRAEVLAELVRADGAEPLEGERPVYEDLLVSADDLSRLRAALLPAPAGLILAVNEVVTNALQHGAPPIIVRAHRGGGRWLCVVTDQGPGLADPDAGIDSPLPGNPGATGYGLWLARQSCAELTITCDADGSGTTVRLSEWR